MNTDPDLISEDARAIAEYLSSDRYRPLGGRGKSFPSPRPARQLRLESAPFAAGTRSLAAGLIGLSLITLFFAITIPVGIHLSSRFSVGQPQFVWMMLIIQTLLLPPIVAFSFATITPMFWYGSIILRFGMATVVVLPGCLGFLGALYLAEGRFPNHFILGFWQAMFACFMTVAVISLTVQMWTPWSLSHRRSVSGPLPPLGTRSMIELTTIAAVGCAVLVSQDVGDWWIWILFFAGFGALAAIAIIGTQITFLRNAPPSRTATLVCLAVPFAGAFMVNGFFAVMEFGRYVLLAEIVLLAAVSLYGAAIIYAIIWVSLRWLRFCGWQCVHRKRDRPVDRDA